MLTESIKTKRADQEKETRMTKKLIYASLLIFKSTIRRLHKRQHKMVLLVIQLTPRSLSLDQVLNTNSCSCIICHWFLLV